MAIPQALCRSGTSGLVLPVPNKRFFPAEFQSKTRLCYYASLFNSIEINSSFYKVPKPATFEKWAGETPVDFRFSIKLWRAVTHQKNFQFLPSDIDVFMRAVNYIGTRKGCILIQLPPSAKDDKSDELEKLLQRVRLSDPRNDWCLAVEFRHCSWYHTRTYKLLRHYLATIVLHDMPGSAIAELPENFSRVYIRFHGPAGDYKGSYPVDFLQSYARRIQNWLSSGKDVYVYFNNTIGESLQNLTILHEWLAAKQ